MSHKYGIEYKRKGIKLWQEKENAGGLRPLDFHGSAGNVSIEEGAKRL